MLIVIIIIMIIHGINEDNDNDYENYIENGGYGDR